MTLGYLPSPYPLDLGVGEDEAGAPRTNEKGEKGDDDNGKSEEDESREDGEEEAIG